MVRLESEPTLRTDPSSRATRARARWPVLITSPQKTCCEVEAATCWAPRTTLTIGTTAVIFPALCATCAETPTGTARSKQIRIAITAVAGGRAFIVLFPPRISCGAGGGFDPTPVLINPLETYAWGLAEKLSQNGRSG